MYRLLVVLLGLVLVGAAIMAVGVAIAASAARLPDPQCMAVARSNGGIGSRDADHATNYVGCKETYVGGVLTGYGRATGYCNRKAYSLYVSSQLRGSAYHAAMRPCTLNEDMSWSRP